MIKHQSLLKRRDISLTGAIILISQALTSFHSSHRLSKEMEAFKASFLQLKIDQEKFFVKKEELKTVVTKLDSVKKELTELNEQIKQAETSHANH